jgi:hypothetical protein
MYLPASFGMKLANPPFADLSAVAH